MGRDKYKQTPILQLGAKIRYGSHPQFQTNILFRSTNIYHLMNRIEANAVLYLAAPQGARGRAIRYCRSFLFS